MLVEAILRRRGGNLSSPDYDVFNKATELLEKLGCRVVQQGVISLTVECSNEQYEEIALLQGDLGRYLESVVVPGRHEFFNSGRA